MIPGPGEPKLHKLNHYLTPIFDQFIELWREIDISTNETSSKHIRAAIICCACDISGLENSVNSYRLVPLVIYVKR